MSNQLPYGDWPYPFNLLGEIIDLEPLFDGLEQEYKKLTDREREVIIYRYRDHLTYDEISKKCGLTRERIRQITNSALRKMNHMRNMKRYYGPGLMWLDGKMLKKPKYGEDPDYDKPNNTDGYSQAFLDLGLSVRSFNCLARKNIRTVEQILIKMKEPTKNKAACGPGLINVRNMGRVSYDEIVKKCEAMTGEDLSQYYDPYWGCKAEIDNKEKEIKT